MEHQSQDIRPSCGGPHPDDDAHADPQQCAPVQGRQHPVVRQGADGRDPLHHREDGRVSESADKSGESKFLSQGPGSQNKEGQVHRQHDDRQGQGHIVTDSQPHAGGASHDDALGYDKGRDREGQDHIPCQHSPNSAGSFLQIILHSSFPLFSHYLSSASILSQMVRGQQTRNNRGRIRKNYGMPLPGHAVSLSLCSVPVYSALHLLF